MTAVMGAGVITLAVNAKNAGPNGVNILIFTQAASSAGPLALF